MAAGAAASYAPFDKDVNYLISPWTKPCKKTLRWSFNSDAVQHSTPRPFASGNVEASKPVPRMADGRQYTDYRPRSVTQFQGRQPMSSSQDERSRLVHSASKNMTNERKLAKDNVSNGLECKSPYDIGTMLPEQDMFVCSKVSCERYDSAFPCTGLGTGRKYDA